MSEFFKHSKSIVEDFLQTAVFLDDRATFIYEEKVAKIIVAPPVRGVEKVTEEPTETNPDENIERVEHLLDAKTIIDTFMNKGIVCSVLKCEEETYDAQVTNYLKLLEKADMIVLDWDLFRDNGDRVVALLEKLLESETDLHPFRSIVIYTANNLESVKAKLSVNNITFPEDSYVSNVPSKYTTISIYSKPDSKEAIEDRTVDFSELVNKCIEDFTNSFHGIVPNVAMASIAEIRNNTHKLLANLNKDLDIAYLSHRALLTDSEDAEKHLEEMVINEIESIIHCNQVGKNARYTIIKKSPFLKNKKYQNIEFTKCLQEGVEGQLNKPQKGRFIKDIKKCFTFEWYLDEEVSKSSEKDFAVLSLFQTNYSIKNLYLTLGVILEEKATTKKLLCLQPRCDSSRLTDDTEFIFLELQKERDQKFDIILPSNEKYILDYGRKYRKTITFSQKNNIISPTKALYFNSIDKKKYRYVGTLKRTQSQRISNEYGAYLSRVGLNESEYLRRNRPKD